MIAKFLEWSARNGAFTLTFFGMCSLLAYALTKGSSDLTGGLTTLLGLYLGQHATTKISGHWAASKDGTCDTAKVIRDLDGIPTPREPEKTNQ